MVDINKLHPAIRQRFINFISVAEKAGIKLIGTSGFRSFDEQQKLYDQGRKTPGSIVTNAIPGSSFHNYGLAVDVIVVVDGKADWQTKLWPEISVIGKSQGFAWGGDWKSFKDLPHFEYPPNTSWKQLMHLKSIGHLDKDGFVIL